MIGMEPRLPKLATTLLKMLGDGALSGTQVQIIAKAAWDDGWGAGSALARRMAHAGTVGRYSGNILRDVVRAAEQAELLSSVAKPYIIKAPGAFEKEVEITIEKPKEVEVTE